MFSLEFEFGVVYGYWSLEWPVSKTAWEAVCVYTVLLLSTDTPDGSCEIFNTEAFIFVDVDHVDVFKSVYTSL